MASKYLQKYPVPQGFPEILHDFAKEILRDQPENIKEFGWQYFKALEEVITPLLTIISSQPFHVVVIGCVTEHIYRAHPLSTRRRGKQSLRLRTANPTTKITPTWSLQKTLTRLKPSHEKNHPSKSSKKNQCKKTMLPPRTRNRKSKRLVITSIKAEHSFIV